jgi:hypothetical protein
MSSMLARRACMGAALWVALIPAAAAASTKVVTYRPAAMHAIATYAGHCPSASHVTARADAVRCTVHLHGSYDPCFVESAHRVACPIDVVRDSGIVVTVANLPPATAGGDGHRPWAMRLSQGQFCIYAGHYTGQKGYPYSCGATACSAPTLAPLNTTYEANCVPVAGHGHNARPFFVATLWE